MYERNFQTAFTILKHGQWFLAILKHKVHEKMINSPFIAKPILRVI